MKLTNSSAASLWSDCTSARWWRLQSLTASWRHTAVRKANVSAQFRPTAPDAEAVWNEAARCQMIQRLWRLIRSRIIFLVSIHHSVTSFLARCSEMLNELVGKLILWLLLFISFCQQWGWEGFTWLNNIWLYNDNWSKWGVDTFHLFIYFLTSSF